VFHVPADRLLAVGRNARHAPADLPGAQAVVDDITEAAGGGVQPGHLTRSERRSWRTWIPTVLRAGLRGGWVRPRGPARWDG